MASGTVHIVGAGLAGLSAAVGLATGRKIVVHELARHAGGRCRSYFEPALGLTIDNGNHLLLSANTAALDFLKTIGTADRLAGPGAAEFPFADLASGERWVLRPNEGRVPWWIFSKRRRVPRTDTTDYLPLARLIAAKRDRALADVIACEGPLYDRLWRPLFLAALNTDPPKSSSVLAGALVRETFLRGGRACHPLIAREGLGPVFIDPALAYLEQHGAKLCFDHQLRHLHLSPDGAHRLDFGEDAVTLGRGDALILAVPGHVAHLFLPDLSVPARSHAIVNAHFKFEPPRSLPAILGVINGTAEWLFSFPGRLSVTISAADRWIETPREELAERVWADICALAGVDCDLPPWTIVKERRATFAALPEENARRPSAQTRWPNIFLAGDWTATGLPATIEGAIRSGNKAARLAMTLQDRQLSGGEKVQ
jgi:hydroxysqualene dehydroxylase